MLKLLLQSFGWTLAHLPEWLLHGCSAALGEAIFWLSARRRRLALSNLDHAFPGRDPRWHRRLARASSRRMVETVLFSLATPYLSVRRIQEIIQPHASLTDAILRLQRDPQPVVLVSPHMAYWEVQTACRSCFRSPFPK